MPPARLGLAWLKSCGFDSAFFLKIRELKPIHRLSAQLSSTCDFSCGSGPRIYILQDFTTSIPLQAVLPHTRDGGGKGEMAGGKERWWVARRDGGGQGETAAGKERQQRARRDGGRQGEMMGGK